ncbi:MAG: hypothetical protein NTY08_15110 [Proteobacteria bacterium]|nr:hypothetical protein [Pseudomonadota bacterium]
MGKIADKDQSLTTSFSRDNAFFALYFVVFLILLTRPALGQSGSNTVVETALPSTQLEAEEENQGVLRLIEHPWERYVRRFRSEHNFALSAGGSTGYYNVESFGEIVAKRFRSGAAWTKFQYSYHVPVYRGFGYLLGSSVGYYYEPADRGRAFQPAPAKMFPGILGGIVMNFTASLRLSAAADVYMLRADRITSFDPVDPSRTEQISVTMVAYDLGGFFDYFYDLNWAIRLETHYRSVYYYRPLQQPGDTTVYASDAVFQLSDHWYGVGLVFHLI